MVATTMANTCHTTYYSCMTMLSFRVEETEANQAQSWADELGIGKSELLRRALHQHLVRLASQHNAAIWEEQPLTSAESAIAQITPS